MEGTPEISVWLLIPFIVMLLTIACAPLVAPKKWESNKVKIIVTAIISITTAIILICAGLGEELLHQILFDYIPFIILLLALFVVTGGLMIKGDVTATPMNNCMILGAGYILASIMGTTGASMLLIRPLIDINKQRTRKAHTILFFIAMVANCGGLLTPLGDPPLFLLYLRGAAFSWFLKLTPAWFTAGAILLVIYYIWDTYEFKREPKHAIRRDISERSPIRVKGRINIIYLLMIILAVVFLNSSYIPAMADGPVAMRFLREYVLLAIVFLSLYTTKKRVRRANHFSWNPIAEVAILFVGIFTTMTPALLYLSGHPDLFGVTQPWRFFYSTGFLSSFLDNAPTAVSFYTMAESMVENGAFAGMNMVAGVPEVVLEAISVGAVFFGSLTYIGNGPNFMVKSIAEESGIKMPSFFGYIFKFSLIVLLPTFIIAQLILIH